MAILLKNKTNNAIKKVPTGYCRGMFFLRGLVPILRGDSQGFRHFVGMQRLTLGLYTIYAPFVYNRRYIQKIVDQGYTYGNEKAKKYLLKKQMILIDDEEKNT